MAGLIAFLVIAVASISWAKWDPYLHKAFTVAATHRLGVSILSGSGTRAAPP